MKSGACVQAPQLPLTASGKAAAGMVLPFMYLFSGWLCAETLQGTAQEGGRVKKMRMKKKYRVTALVLVFAVLCLLFCGCAGGAASGNGGPATEGENEKPLEIVDADASAAETGAEAASLTEKTAPGTAGTAAGIQEAAGGMSTNTAAGQSGIAADPGMTSEAAAAGGFGQNAETAADDAAAAQTGASAEGMQAEAFSAAAMTGASSEGMQTEAYAAGTQSAAFADTQMSAAVSAEGEPDPALQEGTEGANADPGAEENQNQINFDGESDLEYNARQILLADETITKEGALGIAAYLWQMGFGRMSGYPTVGEVNGGKVLTVFDEEGLFYNVLLTPDGHIQQVEDVEGNELIALGTHAGELAKPPISGADVVALLEEWKSHGGHSEVLSNYNAHAHDYGRSTMESDDQWCSETVSAAYAALGIADKIGGMASNGNTYESNARSIGAWVSGGGYIPNTGDILITHDDSGARHTSCVVSCDGHTIKTIAGGGSSIHHGSVSVGSGRITGFVVPEW